MYKVSTTSIMNWKSSLTSLKKGGVQNVFAEDTDESGAKRYTNTNTHHEFVEFMRSRSPQERCFYEVVLPDKPVKLYFDVDICPSGPNGGLVETISSEIIYRTIEKINEYYKINTVQQEDFAIINSSGFIIKDGKEHYKTSFHIVLARKVYFSDIKALKKFIELVFRGKGDLIEGLDTAVYRAGCFRMPECVKKGSLRRLNIMTEHDIYDCLITCINTDLQMQCITNPIQKTKPNLKIDKIEKHAIQHERDHLIADDEILRQCIDVLPSYLSDEYDSWVSIGIKLFLYSPHAESYFHLFSQKSSKYDKGYTHAKWMSFHNSKGSRFAFFNLVEKHCPEIIKRFKTQYVTLMGTYSSEIAQTLAKLYGDECVFCNGEWYFFDSISWKIDTDKIMLSHKIMTDFHKRIDTELQKSKKMIQDIDKESNEYSQEYTQYNKLLEIKEKTQNGRIHTDWHALNVFFHQDHFNELLNSYRHLIGFNNGVYDLNEGVFRESNKDDYITMSTGYNYEEYEDNEDKKREELMDLLTKIFPDPDILNYILMFCASCIHGEIRQEQCHFFTGISNTQTGANGKSTFVSLLLHALGDYASCGHSSIITSKRENPQSSNSAIMCLNGKRIVTFQEIDNDHANNMPVIKAMTGNDLITGRNLYQSQESFLPQWHLIICANKLPRVSTDDGGTRRRIRNIPFESKFVEDIDAFDTIPNVYRIDYELKSKLPSYKLVFMKLLIQYYDIYKKNRYLLPSCRKIEMHTEQYFKNNDITYNWLMEITEKDDDNFIYKKEILRLRPMTVRNVFMNTNEFVEEIEKHLGKMCSKHFVNGIEHKEVFIGFRLKDGYTNSTNNNHFI